MDIKEAMKERHSVRTYSARAIEPELKGQLEEKIKELNAESGLHIQLVFNEPKAFDGIMAHYGKFSGVTSYIAMVGKKGPDLEEKCGYYGEKLVLYAQSLGLNTCWVALTFKKIKSAYTVSAGEKLAIVIAIGYGETQGVAHKSKSGTAVSNASKDSPKWFINGVKAALLAPTAMNQQKFYLTQEGNRVFAKAGGGFYTKIDLGIVKCHFELGAGEDSFSWAE